MQVRTIIFVAQLLYFLGGRLCSYLALHKESTNVVQPIGIVFLILAILFKLIRTRLSLKTKELIKVMMQSQFKMLVPYFLTAVVCYFYYQTFLQAQDQQYINDLSVLSIVLTVLNYGSICHELLLSKVQMWIYFLILMGEMINVATLFVVWGKQEGVQKDLLILFQATFIALHILMADSLMRIMDIQKQEQIKQTYQTRKLLDD